MNTDIFYERLNLLVNNTVFPKGPTAFVPSQKEKTKKIRNKTMEKSPVVSWSNVTSAEVSQYIENPEKGLAGTSSKVSEYLKILTFLMKENFPNETIVITSGIRTPERQVDIMINNWRRNGGDKPLKVPVKRRGKIIRTKGELDTVNNYGLDLGLRFSKSMTTGSPSKQDWVKYFARKVDKERTNHMSGNAIDFRSRGKPFMRRLLMLSKKFSNVDIRDETSRAAPHWHVGVNGINSLDALSFSNPPLSKKGFSVVIEPYNSLVQNALREMQNKLGGDYFRYKNENGEVVEIKKIVLESGNPGHYGMVRSENPDTIYLSMDKIKTEMEMTHGSDAAEEAIKKTIVEVLTHEKGHLDANFQGGEFPAEQESKRNQHLFSAFRSNGLLKEAEKLESLAFANSSLSSSDISQSLLRIVFHFLQSVAVEDQGGYLLKVNEHLRLIDVLEVSLKKKTPSSGVSGLMSLVKSLLSGQDASFVADVIQQMSIGLGKL